MPRLLVIAALVVVGVVIACGGSESATEDIEASLLELAAQIDQIIGEATCDLTNQCRVIPVGSKPCGGPWSYRAYSTVDTDVSALETTVTRFSSLQAELNQRTGADSDCMLVTEPAVRCVSGRCVTQ
jgi:hypothetical protein